MSLTTHSYTFAAAATQFIGDAPSHEVVTKYTYTEEAYTECMLADNRRPTSYSGTFQMVICL